MFLSDLRVGVLLANEARYRTLERFFGIPREQANLATLVAAPTLADAVRNTTRELLRARAPRRSPTRWSALSCSTSSSAPSEDCLHGTPRMFTTLVGIAVLGAPVALRSTGSHGSRIGAVLHSTADTAD